MTAAIVVELPPGDAGSPLLADLLESCSVGSQGRARCVQGPAEESIAVAIVTWDGVSRARVRIEIIVRAAAGGQRLTRALSFSPTDPEAERWRAAGFAIATAVGDAVSHEPVERGPAVEPPPPVRAAPPPAPAETPPPRRREDREARAWWLDGRFVTSGDLQGNAPSFGGGLFGARMIGADGWFLSGSVVATSRTAPGVAIVRPALSLGVGLVPARAAGFGFAMRLEPLVEGVLVSGTDASGATGQASRWLFGFSQSMEVWWMASSTAGVVVGVRVRELGGSTSIQAHGLPVTELGAVDYAGQAGFRLAWP